jgi:hypothetical protein
MNFFALAVYVFRNDVTHCTTVINKLTAIIQQQPTRPYIYMKTLKLIAADLLLVIISTDFKPA